MPEGAARTRSADCRDHSQRLIGHDPPPIAGLAAIVVTPKCPFLATFSEGAA